MSLNAFQSTLYLAYRPVLGDSVRTLAKLGNLGGVNYLTVDYP